jgi:hypothetical protein
MVTLGIVQNLSHLFFQTFLSPQAVGLYKGPATHDDLRTCLIDMYEDTDASVSFIL